jgi:hypothetical protein
MDTGGSHSHCSLLFASHKHTQKAFNYTFTKIVSSVHLPALRTLILEDVRLDKKAWKSVVAALPMPKLGQADVMVRKRNKMKTTTTTPSTLRTVTPLIRLRHLVLIHISGMRPVILHRLFDYLAYHHVALQTLKCRYLYGYRWERKPKAGVEMYQGLDAHLKFGNFPALTSFTIDESMINESLLQHSLTDWIRAALL